MVGCRAVVVALSTARELGLAAVAAAFILFAVVSAFLLPRRDPNFPGHRLPLFVGLTAAFFAAMIIAIAALAREPEEGGHEAEPAAQTETEAETQAQTETQATEPAAQGDASAGKEVFASAGCGACHTLSAADAQGTIGPNLDELKPEHQAIVEQVTNGGGGMPPFKDRLSEEQIQDVSAFVFESTHS
jgi:mono/diheme cytochrome c family protein